MSKKTEKDSAPPAFTDAQGHVWHPRINCNVLRLFEREANCGAFEALGDVVNQRKIGKALTLAYLSCADEAKERNVSLDEFCESFEDDEQTKALMDGIGEAVKLFFRSRTKEPSAAPAGANAS